MSWLEATTFPASAVAMTAASAGGSLIFDIGGGNNYNPSCLSSNLIFISIQEYILQSHHQSVQIIVMLFVFPSILLHCTMERSLMAIIHWRCIIDVVAIILISVWKRKWPSSTWIIVEWDGFCTKFPMYTIAWQSTWQLDGQSHQANMSRPWPNPTPHY